MRLAYPPITISIDGVSATLRPSLRAAYLLEQKHGFPAVLRGVDEGNLGIIADIITFADYDATLANLLRSVATEGITKLDWIKPALFTYLAVLIGVDETSNPGSADSKPVPFGDYFAELFEVATGWLGWTPAEAWAATPAEIATAHRGYLAQRNALLSAIFGGSEEPADPREEVSEEQVRSGLAALKANAMRGKR